jgi:hypothetical protein
MNAIAAKVELNQLEINGLIFMIRMCAKYTRNGYNYMSGLNYNDRDTVLASYPQGEIVEDSCGNIGTLEKFLAFYSNSGPTLDKLKHAVSVSYNSSDGILSLEAEYIRQLKPLLQVFSKFFNIVHSSLAPIIESYEEQYKSMLSAMKLVHDSFQPSLGYKTAVNIDYKLHHAAFYEAYQDATKFVGFMDAVEMRLNGWD